MKKCFAMLLAIVMLATMTSVTAFAAETTITATADAAYTVTIPSTLTVPYNDTTPQTLTVTASGFLLEAGKKVTVSAKGSGASNAFTMANGSNTLAYELSKSSTSWSAVAAGGEVASFTANGTSDIFVKVPSWNLTAAGTYTGTITFTIAYVDAN